MKYSLLLTVLIGIFTMAGIKAQIYQVDDLDFKRFQDDFRLAKSNAEKSGPEYEGSPYLFDEFSPASIVLRAGEGYEDIPMNYNIHNDDFEFMMDDVSYSLGNNNIVKYIEVDGRKFFYRSYTYNSTNIKGYLELVADGKYRFFKKHRVIYTEPQSTTGYKEAQPASFRPRSPDYFIALESGKILYFRRLKDIPDMIPGRAEEIKDYIKDNRLKARREEDIVQLATFLDI
ncbi:MAG: hypothetical protein K9J25_09090 [Bacteroidales bacterium]|nr:hypothetical protein [Bacteroidales bacterium]